MSEQEPTDSDLERVAAEVAAANGKRPCQSLTCGKYIYPEEGFLQEDVFLCRDCMEEDL